MSYDTLKDLTYCFRELTVEQLQAFLTAVINASHKLYEFTYWTTFSEHGRLLCHVSLKRTVDGGRAHLDRIISRDNLPLDSCEEKAFCLVDNCWETRAENRLPDGAMLFDRYGEEVHELHHFCAQHVSKDALLLLKSLDVKTISEEGNEYWTKVVSWKVRKNWYAQRLDKAQDGDYESGYSDYVHATSWLGPCLSREQAIEFANNCEE